MALNDYETSRDRGQPVELYQFTYGPGANDYHAYTDGSAQVLHNGITYDPLPISRTNIRTRGKLEANEIRVTVPATSQIANLFRIYPPGQIVTLRVRQGHVPNPDDPSSWALGENFPVAWMGRVLEAQRDENKAVLTCEAVSASMKRPGLRRHYQWPCPLVLYGTRCRADKAAASATATVSGATGNRITLVEPWGLSGIAPEKYIGGLAEWSGAAGTERRTILRVEGTATLVLSGPVLTLAANDPVTVILGCNHALDDCENLHNNVVNYGGQPFIPTVNPVGKNNHT